MLQKLSIRNYALIDSIDIEFDAGLNLITGETGAGKSIMLGALSLILGQRVESKYFYNQAKKCVIEGVFTHADEKLRPIFESNDLDFYQENILRREIALDGKSRAFVNDTPVNLALLKLIGEHLIAIHSQHATLEIGNSDFQLSLIDALASHDELLQQYKIGYATAKKLDQELTELIKHASEETAKQDYEQFQFDELNNAELQAGEQEALELELEQLTHAEGIKRSLNLALSLLTESENPALQLVKEAISQLQGTERFHQAIPALLDRLRSTHIELKDIADEIEITEQSTSLSPERLQWVQERLDVFYALQQKHRVNDNQALLLLMNQLEEKLNNIHSFEERIEKLKATLDKLTADIYKKATQISANRQKAITKTEKQLNQSLKALALPHAVLKITLNQRQQLNKDGLDDIQLLFSANAGQLPALVNKVASGGELSRLMLALKALLAQHSNLPTLIFDEIDTGISGETALMVGQVMETLGQHMQLVAITHLPQIASKGTAHFFVHKHEQEGKTTTAIRKLSPQERVVAVAEMLSGKNPGNAALQHAQELLNV